MIAAAAAAPMEPGANAALRAQTVVYLRAAPDVLARRLATDPNDDHHRPFVGDAPDRVLAAQYATRDEPYRAIATLIVDAGRPPEVVAAEISAAVRP